MKSILISVKPKYCELIASGKKTIEVRKTKPKLETPFKVYIYETQGRYEDVRDCKTFKFWDIRQKVIGEFVCDKVFDIYEFSGSRFWLNETLVKATCLTEKEINDYGKGKDIFGWHISDLVIYDKPRELGEFLVSGNQTYDCPPLVKLKRPFQSWGYVESECDNNG